MSKSKISELTTTPTNKTGVVGPPIFKKSSSKHQNNHHPNYNHNGTIDSDQHQTKLINQSTNNTNNKKMKKLKCVFVGDDCIGKTSLIVSYTTNGYPTDYVPTTFDTYSVLVTIDNKPCQLQLCDTAGQNDCDSIRPLCYNHADVFLVSFSVVSPRSFRNIRQKWLPEIRRTITNTNNGTNTKSSSRSMPPFILIGTQCDLRHDVKVLIELDSNGEQPISYDYAKSMAKKLGAIDYIECSALTQKNLKEVFDTAILAGLEYQKNQSRHHREHHHHHHHSKHNSKNTHSSSKNHSQKIISSNDHHNITQKQSQTPPMTRKKHCKNDYGYGYNKEVANGVNSSHDSSSSMIYHDFYYHGRKHFVPSTPTKMAHISDAKLVGWRKSLTKLSAEEALKSEAAEASRNIDDDDDDEYDEEDAYIDYPIVQTKLSTFSPLPSPIMSPKMTRKNLINNSKVLQAINPHPRLPFSDPEDDQGFHDETSPSDDLIDSDEHQNSINHNNHRSIKSNQYNYKSSRNVPQQKQASLNGKYSCSSPYSPPLIMVPQKPSSQLLPTQTPYNYGGCYYKQTMIYNHNPYACYQTPYGTTVATNTVAAANIIAPGSGPIIYPRPQLSPPTPVVIHNRSIFQPINTMTSQQKQKSQQPTQSQIAAKTNLAPTLRSSSFFFLPSNTLKMIKQQRKQQQQQRKHHKKVMKSDSIASEISCGESSSASVSSCSSIHSSNELFRGSNNNHNFGKDDAQQQHRKSMLDMFQQIMTASVTELRNRKCSNVFKRLASSLSSSGSSSSPNNTSSSSSGTNKEKQRLKSEKLKDLYYYDSYDYEEIDLDRRTSLKCCPGSGGSIWSMCCFRRNF